MDKISDKYTVNRVVDAYTKTGLQEDFLRRITKNRRKAVSFYAVEEDAIRKALEWE